MINHHSCRYVLVCIKFHHAKPSQRLLRFPETRLAIQDIFFSIWVLFHEYSRFTGQQGKGDGIYLTHLYHFYPLLTLAGRLLERAHLCTSDGLQSKVLCISWMIAISCWTDESLRKKPDWCGERRLFPLKYLNKPLKMMRSDTGSKETGL